MFRLVSMEPSSGWPFKKYCIQLTTFWWLRDLVKIFCTIIFWKLSLKTAPQKGAESCSCEIWYEVCAVIITVYLRFVLDSIFYIFIHRRADKSLARPGRKQARKHVRDARDFNNIEARSVINLFFLQGKAPKEIDAILTETLACFLPGRAKDLSAALYYCSLNTTGMSHLKRTLCRILR
jgi:hypothetical protein